MNKPGVFITPPGSFGSMHFRFYRWMFFIFSSVTKVERDIRANRVSKRTTKILHISIVGQTFRRN